MSLQVWLPLCGNLDNYGLSPITTSGVTGWKTDGKIGQNALNLKTDRVYINCDALKSAKTLSICFWAMVEPSDTLTSSWQDIMGFKDVSSSGTAGTFRWETVYSTSSSLWGVHWHDNATNAFVNGSHNHNAARNEWVHCCVVFDSQAEKIYSYDNGILTQTHNYLGGSVNASGQFYFGEKNNIEGKIQDVRIYDHALSQKEVKEISKALILHYRLSNNIKENLLKGNFSCTSTNTEYKSQGSLTTTLTNEEIIANKGKTLTLSYDVYSMGDSTSSAATGSWQVNRFGLHGSIKYTTSNTSSTQYYPFADLLSKGKDGHYTTSWTIPTDIISIETPLGIAIQTSQSEGFARPAATNAATWYLRNIKLEWGSTSTSWCPNREDTEYEAYGYNIEWDCGIGNNFNGIKNGDISYNFEDSPRYISSSYFNSTTVNTTSNTLTGAAYIVAPCTIPETQSISIAWWDKIMSYGRGGIFETTSKTSDFVNGSDYNTTAFANWDSTFGVYNGTTRVNLFNNILKDSQWHHYVITYNGTNVILYRDGVAVQTTALTGDLPAFNGIKIGIGKAGGVYRQIRKYTSDFRIYATALSAEDVLELYHTAAAVDNQGNTHAYEFIE